MPKGKEYPVPDISNDLALFLGMFTGDGCLSLNYNGDGHRIYPIGFFNTKKELMDVFSLLFDTLFQTKGVVRLRKRKGKKPMYGFEKYSISIFETLVHIFEIPCGKKALTVRIPSFIRNGDPDLQKHFFLGYLVTDGSIKKNNSLLFHTASEELAYDLQQLIFDIWGCRREIRTYIQRGGYRSYQISLNNTQGSMVLRSLPPSHNLVLRRT